MSKKRHEPHEEHADESWLLPYSDLMTLLLALFIVLYAASAVNITKLEELSRAFRSAFSSGVGILDSGTTMNDDDRNRKTERDMERNDDGSKRDTDQMEREQQNLEELKEKLDSYIQTNGLSSQLETTLNQTELLITIRDNALFPSGSASIKPEAQLLANAIALMLEDYPDYEILVTGHTDDQPINTFEFPSNWELSFKRALNFMKILLENPAFDPKRFSAIGYGEFRPVSGNETVEGRAQNRRVEISLLRKFYETPGNGQRISTAVGNNSTGVIDTDID